MNHALQAPAALIDFTGIEYGRDAPFFLSLDHYLESWLTERDVFRLPGPRLLILVPDAAAPSLFGWLFGRTE